MKEGVIPSYSETCPPIDPGIPNTRMYIPVSGFGGELRPIINRTIKFTRVTSEAIGEEFARGMERHGICDREAIQKDSLHLPGFDIYDSNNAQPVLEQTDYAEEVIDPHGLLLVYRLPSFTEEAWIRALELGQTPTEMSKSIEYELGRRSTAAFTSQREDHEKRKRLSFRRINEAKIHEPGVFYHLWEITPPEGIELKNRTRRKA